jgi:branched-chain amino acid transport system substrate-binding protein
MRTSLRAWALLVVAAVAVGTMSMACQKATIPIGAIISLTTSTGPSVDGEGVRDGLQLAVEEANARGGINGRKLELILADAKSNDDEAKAAFDRIEKARHPLFYVSTLSNPSLALGPLAGQAQVPLFCLISASPKITQGTDWAYRYWPSAATYAPVYLSLLAKLGAKRLGVLYLNDEFGTSLYELIRTEFTKRGGSIRGEPFCSASRGSSIPMRSSSFARLRR